MFGRATLPPPCALRTSRRADFVSQLEESSECSREQPIVQILGHGLGDDLCEWATVSQIWLFLTRCSAAGGLSGFKAAIGTGRAFFFW